MSATNDELLAISQLESLRFKANQIIESIQSLQRTIDFSHLAISAWPDILSKYNVLLSQTHSFSNSLNAPLPGTGITALAAAAAALPRINGAGTSAAPSQNPFEKIALHPQASVSDVQLDTEIIPLLRNQQTTDVLNMENETVRRLSEHMLTRGSVGVLGGVPVTPPTRPVHATQGTGLGVGVGVRAGGYAGQSSTSQFATRKPEYEDVLQECADIRGEHDRRAERAVRAVMLLRDKFDWKPRVEVEVEEPEELDWDPRLMGAGGGTESVGADAGGEQGVEGQGDDDLSSGDGASSDEDEVEGHLVQDEDAAPGPSSILSATNGDVEMG